MVKFEHSSESFGNNRRASMWLNLGSYNNEEIASENKDKLAKK